MCYAWRTPLWLRGIDTTRLAHTRWLRSPSASYRCLAATEEYAMRNTLTTPFWQAAYRSLPEEVRHRYLAHLQSAERWELRLDATIEAASRAKAALARLLQTPGKPRS